MFFYRIFRFFTFPIFWIVLKIRYKDAPSIFNEKIGRPTQDRPNGRIVWLHAYYSSDAADALDEIIRVIPRTRVIVTYVKPTSDTTCTANAIYQYAPIDSRFVVRKFLKFWEPFAAIRIASEIRPMQLYALKKFDIPSFLIHGEMSKKSYRLWKLARRFANKLIGKFTFVWAVNNEQTLRLANLGAVHIKSEDGFRRETKLAEILTKINQMSES